MKIKPIQDKILIGDYRISDHAVKRMIKRSIDSKELEETIISGEIIEEYPDDKYSPSCLIYGKTNNGRHFHIQVSIPPLVVIVTIYEPDPEEWINYKIRK
jgi:hypothetical protein